VVAAGNDPSDCTPRSISALACSKDVAAIAMAGRILKCMNGSRLGELK